MKQKITLAILLLTVMLTSKPAFAVYNPMTGRWLTRDPIGERGGINLYQFVGNNPVNFADPFGLMGIISTTDGSIAYVSTAQQFINVVGALPDGTIASIDFTGHTDPTSQGISDDSQTKESLELLLGKYPMITGPSIGGKSVPIGDVLKNKMAPKGKINLGGCNAGKKNPDKKPDGSDLPNLPQAISSVVPDVPVSGSALHTFGGTPSYGNWPIPFTVNTYINGKKQ